MEYENIPLSLLKFAKPRQETEKLPKKSGGYFRDAWGRFRKNRFSVAAAGILLAIVAFALLVPLVSPLDAGFMDPYYAKKVPAICFWPGSALPTAQYSGIFRRKI